MGRPRTYDPICSVVGCERPHSCHGLCAMHDMRVRSGYKAAPRLSPAERFWDKVDKNGLNGCWVWTAGLNSAGYGQFTMWPGPPVRAHRFSWEQAHGPITDGLCVLHRCDNRPCVNPDHLFLGTRGDNIRDCFAKGRGNPTPGARAAAEVHRARAQQT